MRGLDAGAPTPVVPRGSKLAKPAELGSPGLSTKLATPLLWPALRVVSGRTTRVGRFS